MVETERDPVKLADTIDKLLHAYEHDEEELVQFITSVFHNSFSIPDGESKGVSNAEIHADAIYPQIRDFI